jgi:hypothetical protein
MPPRNHPAGLLVVTIVLAITLLPAAALAQAGLSGDPFGGQEAERLGRNSQFDKTFQSKSALGQLEELTGTKVDRSSSQRNTVSRLAPQSRSVTPRFNANQAFQQEMAGQLAGALVGALFADIFSDNSAQQRAAAEAAAAQAAAQAAAEAEAFRVQQELARQARIRRAQHYRAEWDAREGEITDRLGGAFDVTAGTAFFGRPANPDADAVAAILGQDVGGATQASGEVPDASASDPSVVDLRGSSGVVQMLQQPTPVIVNRRSPTITRSTMRAPATPPGDGTWQEIEPTPEPRNEWWTHMRSYSKEKMTDMGLAYLFMGIKEAGGDSVPAFASLPDKIKEALDLKKKIAEHITESVRSTLSIAGEATYSGANYSVLVNRSSNSLEANAGDLKDDANSGAANSFLINVGPEDPTAATGIGIAQGLHSDLPGWLKWGRGESGGP